MIYKSRLTILVLFMLILAPQMLVAYEEPLSKELNVYNWEGYFGPNTISDFEKKYGIKVNLFTFENEDELVANLESNPEKYDVIVASGDLVSSLIKMRLLAPVNLKNIPNLTNIGKDFLNQHYDKKNSYSIPYMWGTTGIVVNRAKIPRGKSWDILFNPSYAGKVAMLNSYDEVFGAVLKSLGYSYNTKDMNELRIAKNKMLSQVKNMQGYHDVITIREKMMNNELWAAHIYSGEGVYAARKNSDLEYFIPDEGSVMWIDNLAIPRDSQRKNTAELFINYILEPRVSADIANYLWYANCNEAAKEFTNKELLSDQGAYPPKDIMNKCEVWNLSELSENYPEVRQFWMKAVSELISRIKK